MHPQSVIRTPVIFLATILTIREGMIRRRESFLPPADRADHVEAALFHRVDQAGDLLRRVLEIRIEGHDDLAADDGKTGQDRRMLSVIPASVPPPGPRD